MTDCGYTYCDTVEKERSRMQSALDEIDYILINEEDVSREDRLRKIRETIEGIKELLP